MKKQANEEDFIEFGSLEELYREAVPGGRNSVSALKLLNLRDFYNSICDFDPRSGLAQSCGLDELCERIINYQKDDREKTVPNDNLSRIIEHVFDSVRKIISLPRERILREHIMRPIFAVREVDSTTIKWLSQKAGRNLREKLAGKPYLKAVNRRMNLNNAENRLFKAFVSRLLFFLENRGTALGFTPRDEELTVCIKRWLYSDEVAEVGLWENLTPNNTLLQEKYYRRIWDGWLWLQNIDSLIVQEQQSLTENMSRILFWLILSSLSASEQIRLVQQPCFFDYDTLDIQGLEKFQGLVFSDGVVEELLLEKKAAEILIKTKTYNIKINFEPGKTFKFVFTSPKSTGKTGEFAPEISSFAEIVKLVNFFILKKAQPGVLENHNSISGSEAVLDICAVRPEFIVDDNNVQKTPFRLLWQFMELEKEGRLYLDGSFCRAWHFRPESENFSMFSLFYSPENTNQALLNEASSFFVRKLSDYLNVKKLTYLVPDSISDFAMENIRRNINRIFTEAQPLPVSIAAVFACLDEVGAEKNKLFKSNDLVIVLQNGPAGLFATPLVCCSDNKLRKVLPESSGIYWERLPSIELKGLSESEIIESIFASAKKSGGENPCPVIEEINSLLGTSGLKTESGKLSFLSAGDKWYNLLPDLPERLQKAGIPNVIDASEISVVLKQSGFRLINARTFILPASDFCVKPAEEKDFVWLKRPDSLVNGGRLFARWQKKAGDIFLWHDHLPELAITVHAGGGWRPFPLVKKQAVVPCRGKKINIPVKETFILPAGKKSYSFPLMQGAGGKKLRYMAFLKSSAFPLSQDVECKLEMTYNYGADDPYELRFLPENPAQAGFKSVTVEWRPVVAMENSPVPDFPPKPDWEYLCAYPSKREGEKTNLPEWIERDNEYIKNNLLNRHSGILESWGETDSNGYVFGEIEYENKLLRFYENGFLDKNIIEDLKPGDRLYFKLISSIYGYKPTYISSQKYDFTKEGIAYLKKRLRFPVLMVWNFGRSLAEPFVPDSFRKSVMGMVKDVLTLLNDGEVSGLFREELFLRLCFLHRDAPAEVVKELTLHVDEKEFFIRNCKAIAFAVGAADLPWQNKLLQAVIEKIRNETLLSYSLEMMSIILWRHERIIFLISAEQLGFILNVLYGQLQILEEKILEGTDQIDLTFYLELLLALLRSRGSEDENIRKILAVGNKMTEKFLSIVDEIAKKIMKFDIDLKSRIDLQLDKPPEFHKTPDLIYALRMYLSGDTGADSIKVKGVGFGDG